MISSLRLISLIVSPRLVIIVQPGHVSLPADTIQSRPEHFSRVLHGDGFAQRSQPLLHHEPWHVPENPAWSCPLQVVSGQDTLRQRNGGNNNYLFQLSFYASWDMVDLFRPCLTWSVIAILPIGNWN
jgi:hypothetical protein